MRRTVSQLIGFGRVHVRGLSLVELMVGIVVSLFIVAAATLLVSNNLSENRRMLLEMQLQQDLRATADIVTRELRRIGYLDTAADAVPSPNGSAISANQVTQTSTSAGVASTVYYKYRRANGAESFGFRLEYPLVTGANGVAIRIGVVTACQSDNSEVDGLCASGWQDLTDRNTADITEFRVETIRSGDRARTQNRAAMVLPCPKLCADGTTTCWPSTSVQEYEITITGRSRTDPAVVRALRSSVRARNDRVVLSAEAPAGQSCPG